MRARFVPPMAAELVDRLPEGNDWMYEVKLPPHAAFLGLRSDKRPRSVRREG